MFRAPSFLLRSAMLLVLGAAMFLAMAAPTTISAAPKLRPLAIGDARALPLGSVVTVAGTVTVPSGVFKSATFDEGFAIQDSSGGIYVSIQTNLGLDLRQRVQVTGTLAESFGLLILVPASPSDVVVREQGNGPVVPGKRVRTADVTEATEGQLVRVTGTVTQPVGDDLPYGFRLFVDDGSGEIQAFVHASANIDLSQMTPGTRVSVTGFSGQFDDHYEVAPRFQSDVVVLR